MSHINAVISAMFIVPKNVKGKGFGVFLTMSFGLDLSCSIPRCNTVKAVVRGYFFLSYDHVNFSQYTRNFYTFFI